MMEIHRARTLEMDAEMSQISRISRMFRNTQSKYGQPVSSGILTKLAKTGGEIAYKAWRCNSFRNLFQVWRDCLKIRKGQGHCNVDNYDRVLLVNVHRRGLMVMVFGNRELHMLFCELSL